MLLPSGFELRIQYMYLLFVCFQQATSLVAWNIVSHADHFSWTFAFQSVAFFCFVFILCFYAILHWSDKTLPTITSSPARLPHLLPHLPSSCPLFTTLTSIRVQRSYPWHQWKRNTARVWPPSILFLLRFVHHHSLLVASFFVVLFFHIFVEHFWRCFQLNCIYLFCNEKLSLPTLFNVVCGFRRGTLSGNDPRGKPGDGPP